MKTPRIDAEKIEELKALVDDEDPDFLTELIDEYLISTEEGLKALRYAIQAKDTVTVVRTAHTLKGASSNLGVLSMAELSEQVESLGSNDSLNGAIEIVEKLESEFSEVRTDLQHLTATS